MRHVYIDESIHDRGDFITVAAVFADRKIDAEIAKAIESSGFVVGSDEFKSSMRMADNVPGQELRGRLRGLLMNECRLAVAVCPIAEREDIVPLVGKLIASLHPEDKFPPSVVHFDQGIKTRPIELPEGWSAHLNCDSRKVLGIQIADCAAHTISIILLSQMGLINKTVATGNFYPEPEVEMAWELWASLRYALSSHRPRKAYGKGVSYEPIMKPFGLLVSDACSDAVKRAVKQKLSSVWVGCIH